MPATTSDGLKPKAVNGVPVKNEEPVAPQEPDVKPAADDKVTINLQQAHYNVYTQPEAAALGLKLDNHSRAVFGPGDVTVSKDMAEDLLRREREIMRAERERIDGIANAYSGEIAQIG